MEQQWKQLVSCNSTSYNVQVSLHPSTQRWSYSCRREGLTVPLCVQNLLPERQYKFRVRAENIYGVGEPSAESEPVTVRLVDEGEETRTNPSHSFLLNRCCIVFFIRLYQETSAESAKSSTSSNSSVFYISGHKCPKAAERCSVDGDRVVHTMLYKPNSMIWSCLRNVVREE